jgi:hypothetical protein
MPRAISILGALLLSGVAVTVSAPLLAAPKAARSPKAGKAPASLCSASAERHFSCRTKNQKAISLCREAGKAVEYRFGTHEKIELSYPKSKEDEPLRYAHYARAQAERVEVTFSSGGADYAVFDYEEDGRREAGVRAALASGREVTIACVGAITGRLSELAEALPCDADNALNMGSCPKARP